MFRIHKFCGGSLEGGVGDFVVCSRCNKKIYPLLFDNNYVLYVNPDLCEVVFL